MFPVLIFLALSSPTVLAGNILAVFSIPSYSHQIVYRALTLELNKRGHNLTVITPNPVKNPNLKNYREIDVSFIYPEFVRRFVGDPTLLRTSMNHPELLYFMFMNVSSYMCHSYYSHPEIQGLIRENPKFDLTITEYSLNPCFYALSKFSDYKYVGIFSFQLSATSYSILGSLVPPSYIPDVNFPFLGKMSFYQRVRTLVYQIVMRFINIYFARTHDSIVRQYLGYDVPNLADIERNVSVVLVNSHFSMAFPRPNGLNVVDIGGPAVHLTVLERKPLRQDIQEFMDGAEHGVIYFSLGTNVKTNNMSTAEEEVLLESFKRMKQRILWKWENEKLKINLENVKVGKWFPQTDVLAHPKVKAFVTQGGLQSVGEAIENHIPMVIMPFFADQNQNAQKMTLVGVAKTLNFDSLKVDEFTKALNEIIYDPKYKQNIIDFSKLIKDQPMPPLEKAVWWTEYVLRHNGAPHLRSAAVTMPWYQYFMLDVLAAALLILIIITYIVYLILRAIMRLIFKSEKTKKE